MTPEPFDHHTVIIVISDCVTSYEEIGARSLAVGDT